MAMDANTTGITIPRALIRLNAGTATRRGDHPAHAASTGDQYQSPLYHVLC